ncbi:MAG: hypothetical protein HY692_02765 [Cyanobacteria bacterium NC_groundwater_1444_Ag_S-0.65um_54_12]|nr:hypothetical protein [Cyanobacteria bacterium NC_groundwater_1444_Ag_S-0.65um_54_12]
MTDYLVDDKTNLLTVQGSFSRIWRAYLVAILAISLLLQIWAIVITLSYVGKNFPGFRFEPTLTVSSFALAAWPGSQAGLTQQERILQVEGKQLAGPDELWRLARSTPAGTP